MHTFPYFSAVSSKRRISEKYLSCLWQAVIVPILSLISLITLSEFTHPFCTRMQRRHLKTLFDQSVLVKKFELSSSSALKSFALKKHNFCLQSLLTLPTRVESKIFTILQVRSSLMMKTNISVYLQENYEWGWRFLYTGLPFECFCSTSKKKKIKNRAFQFNFENFLKNPRAQTGQVRLLFAF